MKRILLFFLAAFLIGATAFAQAPLRSNDTFEMQLSGVPAEYALDYRNVYTVGEDGNVKVPLVGLVRAAGLTSQQLARSIEQKLVDGKIFTNPTVHLILAPQSRFVTVGGGVRVPSAVPWSADLSLSAAIKRAGGLSEWGSDKKVRVIRDGKVAVFNLRNAGRDPNQNPKLLPGDEVEVPD